MDALENAAKLADCGDVEQAHRIATGHLRQVPEDPRAAFVVASCHLRANRPETAYLILRGIQKHRDYDGPQLWNAIGHSLAEMERWDESEKWYARALSKGPNAVTYASFASIYTKKGDPSKAVDMAERALALDPENAEAKWNGALALLKLGEWKKGWEWYDTTIGTKTRPNPPAIDGKPYPMWKGKGGNLLVYGEQGLGDEIMFSSILPDVVRDADRVVCIVDKRLVNLLGRSFPDVIFADRKGKELVLPEPIELTHSISIASLGRLYRNEAEDFSGEPYLKADPELSIMYRALVDSLGEGKKIGVMWKGGRGGLDEFERLIPLYDFEAIAQNGHLISLNHLPEAKSELDRLYDTSGVRIHHWQHGLEGDYDRTAALVSALDCVVSITGTVGHLAAALGVETHILVPKMPQWRYGHQGDSIPWYKVMKLHRQIDSWPMEEIAEAL